VRKYSFPLSTDRIGRSLQPKKDLKKSLVTKYPKSEINGLWEERIQVHLEFLLVYFWYEIF
jgi:hypothetical protein